MFIYYNYIVYIKSMQAFILFIAYYSIVFDIMSNVWCNKPYFIRDWILFLERREGN